MKKILGCLLFLSSMLTAAGQQLFLETGMLISSFDYKDSNGNSPGNLKGTYQGNLGLGGRMAVMQSPWHVSLLISNNKYGASCSDQTLGNYSEWYVSYLSLNLGVDYEFFKPPVQNADRKGFSFYLKGIFATEFFINGKQNLNSQVFDLAGVEEFDKPVYFLKAGTGVNYYLTRSYIVFAEYIFGRSILFGNYDGQEQLHYMTHCVSIGFLFNFSAKRK